MWHMEQNDRLYDIAVSDNNASYSRAMWILVGVMIVVLAVIFAVWFGIKASLVAPMNRLIDSIRHIAGGDLVKPIEVDGSNEMGQLAESLRHMQGELMRTVGDVRNGPMPSIAVPAKSPPAITISLRAPSNRPLRWKRRQPAWSN